MALSRSVHHLQAVHGAGHPASQPSLLTENEKLKWVPSDNTAVAQGKQSDKVQLYQNIKMRRNGTIMEFVQSSQFLLLLLMTCDGCGL